MDDPNTKSMFEYLDRLDIRNLALFDDVESSIPLFFVQVTNSERQDHLGLPTDSRSGTRITLAFRIPRVCLQKRT